MFQNRNLISLDEIKLNQTYSATGKGLDFFMSIWCRAIYRRYCTRDVKNNVDFYCSINAF